MKLTNQISHPARVIYVHPETPMEFRATLPLSLPALIRRLGEPVQGWYAADLGDDAIRAAQVVLADVHWYLSIAGAFALSARVRAINPRARIVFGGLTASLYARQFVGSGAADFVVRGDAEVPLERLVAALLHGGDLGAVPNLVGPDGLETPMSYRLTPADLNANEFFDIDFFPAFRRDIYRLHQVQRSWPGPLYPYLVPFRGCPLDCAVCSGAPGEQRKIFGRGVVVRAAERVAEDRERIEADPNLTYVNELLDYLTLLPEAYADIVLRRRSRLKVQYEFATPPTAAALAKLLGSYAGGVIRFSADDKHTTSAHAVAPDVLVPLVRQVQRARGYTPVLEYSGEYAWKDRSYRAAVLEVWKRTRCTLFDAAYWWTDFPRPLPGGYADPESFERFRREPLAPRFRYLYQMGQLSRVAGMILPEEAARRLRLSAYALTKTWPFVARAMLADRRDGRPPPAAG